VALTVAGSDSGGGGGVQADLKTLHALGVFGTSAITCLTAQNPLCVSRVEAASPRIVAEQMERVLEAFPVSAAKTGMLYDAGIIETVGRVFRRHKFRNLVVDPVMVATSGARLLKTDAVEALTSRLLPLALVVTPNRAEAEVLWGQPIRTRADQRAAAEALAQRFGVAFLVKGGHLLGAVDVLSGGHEFAASRVVGIKTHGTGCVLSAAITASLALGCSLRESVTRAKRFVTRAIRDSVRVGRFQTLKI
jgi:hydroxymethylpyrimidine/phosphomethylpyrimidine kinase